jgi:hypothetical protein
MMCRMRRPLVVLGLGAALLVAGCGGSHPPATTAADAQVNSGSCVESGLRGKPPVTSCTFVLNDGRRLGCNRSFTGPTPTVSQLVRDGCRWLAAFSLSRAMRAVIARIDSGRSCLTSKGLHAIGGPVFPSGLPDPRQADGELVVRSSHPTFIAFYTDAARAARTEPALRRDDAGKHIVLERRGAVMVAWTQTPDGDLRHTVWECVA